MAGFRFFASRAGTRDIMREVQIAASATVQKGDALEFVSGKAKRVNAAADTVRCIAAEDATSTATSLTKIPVIDVFGAIFETDITPLLDDVAISASTTTTITAAMSAGATDDLVGGIVYANGLHRIISGNTYGGGNVVITVLEAFPSAPTGNVRLVPFGYGTVANKLHASTMYNAISTAIADISGGTVAIHDVLLDKKVARVYFV